MSTDLATEASTEVNKPSTVLRSHDIDITPKIKIPVLVYNNPGNFIITPGHNTESGVSHGTLNNMQLTQNFRNREFKTSLAPNTDPVNNNIVRHINITENLITTDNNNQVSHNRFIFPMSKGNYMNDNIKHVNPNTGEKRYIQINDIKYEINETHDANYIISLKESKTYCIYLYYWLIY